MLNDYGRRLWSLWDVKQLFVSHIVAAAAQIERIDAVLSERAKRSDFDDLKPMSAKVRNGIARAYEVFASSADAMGAPVTASSARRAVKKLRARKKPLSYRDVGAVSNEISNIMNDEIASVKLYCLDPGADAYYSPTGALFGTEVESRIPKASNDISEAGKCFAVGRYTASVFHLMRAMEAAVQTLSTDLGIGNPEREWGKLLSYIGGQIEGMAKGDERNNWSQVHANLYHVKQAWRNDTMHPKATYTEEEAREVFDAVKAFMRHLATMLTPTVEEMIG